MAVIRGIEIEAQLIPNADGILYDPANTGNGATRGVITAAVSYANAATTGVEVNLVKAGGSSSTTNQNIKKDFALDETFTWPSLIGQTVVKGGALRGNDGGNGGTGVNIRITVTEFTGDS